MLECPRCRKRVPEVLGAPEQQCPHCRHAFRPYDHALAAAAAPVPQGPGAREVPPDAAPGEGRGTQGLAPADAVSRGFGIYLRHLGTFMLFWLPVLVADLGLRYVGIAWSAHHGHPDLTAVDPTASAENRAFLLRFLGFMLPFYLGLVILKLTYWGAHAPLVNTALNGGTPTARAGWHVIRERWRSLLATASAFTVVLAAGAFLPLAPIVFVLTLDPTEAAGPVGVLLAMLAVILAIPFFAFVYWYLYAPAAASGRHATLARAFSASRAFARRKRATGFATAVVLVILAGLALAASAGHVGVALAEAVAPAWRVHLEETFVGLATWILGPLSATLAAAYWHGAGRVTPATPERATEPQAPAVAATADATGSSVATVRLKTTKCPACTTVFPFKPDPEGAASRVECPTCGKTGLIR